MEPVKIPRRIDEPLHLLLWSVDEVAPMMIGLVMGIVIGKATICFLVGLAFTNLYRRFKDNNPDGYMLHMLYWGGYISTKAQSMKNPYARRYFP